MIQVLERGATSRQVDRTSKIDIDMLETLDSDNTVQVVGHALGEGDRATVITAIEGRNNVGSSIATA